MHTDNLSCAQISVGGRWIESPLLVSVVTPIRYSHFIGVGGDHSAQWGKHYLLHPEDSNGSSQLQDKVL